MNESTPFESCSNSHSSSSSSRSNSKDDDDKKDGSTVDQKHSNRYPSFLTKSGAAAGVAFIGLLFLSNNQNTPATTTTTMKTINDLGSAPEAAADVIGIFDSSGNSGCPLCDIGRPRPDECDCINCPKCRFNCEDCKNCPLCEGNCGRCNNDKVCDFNCGHPEDDNDKFQKDDYHYHGYGKSF